MTLDLLDGCIAAPCTLAAYKAVPNHMCRHAWVVKHGLTLQHGVLLASTAFAVSYLLCEQQSLYNKGHMVSSVCVIQE